MNLRVVWIAAVAALFATGRDKSAVPVVVQASQPFKVGEVAEYEMRLGWFPVGEASLAVVGIDSIRGRAAYHFRLVAKAKVGVLAVSYQMSDTSQSWVDTATFESLRFNQDILDNKVPRTRRFEIFPERATYTEGGQEERPSVASPLDDISFLFFVRKQPFVVGASTEISQYFKPAGNPVAWRVLKRESIEAAGRKWATVVVQPTIKSSRLFSADSDPRLWISDDSARVIVQINTKLAHVPGTISMKLKSFRSPPQ